MKDRGGSVFLSNRAVRLFKRADRPTQFWQAAFRRAGQKRPLVKSTGQADLSEAKRWALGYLAQFQPPPAAPPAPVASGASRENLLGAYPFPKIRQEKRHVERELALRTLTAYAQDPHISQRRLAQQLQISLAVVNVYTARSVRAGWLLKLGRAPGQGSGYRYLLTDVGQRQLDDLQQAFIADELSFYCHIRGEFAAMLARHAEAEIIVAGSGALAEIARSVLMEAGVTPLASVSADQLHDLTRHAVKRHRRHAVLWLAGPTGAEAIRAFAARHLPDMPVLAPNLL
jgi:hypothetical protein